MKGGESGEGTSGVVEAVKAGDGTIGYADASQAGDLGIAKIKVGNTYVAPSAEGAADGLRASQKDPAAQPGPERVRVHVERTSTDPAHYPILLVSYLMSCTSTATRTTDIVKALFNYIDQRRGPAGRGAERRLGADPAEDPASRSRPPSTRSAAERRCCNCSDDAGLAGPAGPAPGADPPSDPDQMEAHTRHHDPRRTDPRRGDPAAAAGPATGSSPTWR